MQNVIGEIKIMMSKSTSYIILVLISGFCEFLEFRNDQVIASGSLAERTHEVMDFLTAIYAENNISHLTVTELHHFVVEKDTIRGKCETELLIMKFLLFSSVGNQVLDHLPVHQRLTAKEINFQVSS